MSNFRIHLGDCLEVMPGMPADSFHSIVTDPPYGLEFMGKHWDHGIPGVQFWKEALRVARPGAHLLAFGGTRTHHRLMVAIEDAGWIIRDVLSWLYGCLSEDTEILIEGKWEPYHKAIVGKRALCYDVGSDTFQWQEIQELVTYDYADTAYRIQSDRTDQIVSRNHRCIVKRGGRNAFRYAEALERAESVPILEDLPALFDAVPLPNKGASGSQKVLRQDLRGGIVGGEENGTTQAVSGSTRGVRRVRGLREGSLEAPRMASESCPPNVQLSMQRGIARGGVGQARAQGAGGMDGRGEGILSNQNEWGEQSGMEGRRYIFSKTWQLQADQVRSMPGGVRDNGAPGRVRYGASAIGRASVGSPVVARRSRPPRGSRSGQQRIGESAIVREQPGSQVIRTSGFTRSDMATVTPIEYRGVVWCVRVPTGAFVARRNGKVFVTGNSGFPKSLNIGQESGLPEWEGWGTGLKPAWEPVILAMKPMPGTFAQNAANFGVAGINIDASRIEAAPGELIEQGRTNRNGKSTFQQSEVTGKPTEYSALGRWPANVLFDEEAAAMLDEQSGTSKSNRRPPTGKPKYTGSYEDSAAMRASSTLDTTTRGHNDSGGASRFFKNVASEPVCYLCGLPINEGHGIMTGKGDHLLWSKSAKNAETNSAQRITEAINDSATTNVQREQPQRSGGKPEPSNENANNAGNRIGDTQANASGFVPTNAELDRFGKIAQNVPIAENLCDLCGTSIVLSIAVMQLGRSPESIVGQVFIPAHKKQTLMQCLVSFAGALGSTDTIPTTENLILWFGYVRDAMRNSIPTEGTADVQAQTSRLFYRSKASKADRDDGLEGMEDQLAKSKFNLNNGSGDLRFDGAPTPTRKNIHPTVKPTELMRYLCAMVTPEGGRVLDPFMGSGSTGRGAMMGGFLFEGIEREAEYVEISKRRIAAIKPQAIQGRFI